MTKRKNWVWGVLVACIFKIGPVFLPHSPHLPHIPFHTFFLNRGISFCRSLSRTAIQFWPQDTAWKRTGVGSEISCLAYSFWSMLRHATAGQSRQSDLCTCNLSQQLLPYWQGLCPSRRVCYCLPPPDTLHQKHTTLLVPHHCKKYISLKYFLKTSMTSSVFRRSGYPAWRNMIHYLTL